MLIAFSAAIVMMLLAAGASLMRGERYVHAEADGALVGLEREADAVAASAVLGEDVAFDDAIHGRPVTRADLRS